MFRIAFVSFVIFMVLSWIHEAGFMPWLGSGDRLFLGIVSLVVSIIVLGLFASKGQAVSDTLINRSE